MKIVDVIFALICGWAVAWIAGDILRGMELEIGWWIWFIHWILPITALFGLWITYLLGKKFIFIFQAGKYFLIGAFSAVVDIKIFQLSTLIFGIFALTLPLIAKTISFLMATLVKYWGNKHWAFLKLETDGIIREIIQFFAVTLVGLAIDLSAFYYFTAILGPQYNIPVVVWRDLSIIFAALAAAVWNFAGYKFFVFKK